MAAKRKKATRRRKKPVLEESISREIWAVVLLFLGILLLVALLNGLGDAGKWMNYFLVTLFGQGAFVFPFSLFGASIALFLSRSFDWSLYSLVGIFLLFFSIQGFLHTSNVPLEFSQKPLESGGGMFGVAASVVFRSALGDTGAYLILIACTLIGVLLTFQISLMQMIRTLGNFLGYTIRLIFSVGETKDIKVQSKDSIKKSKKLLKKKQKDTQEKTIITSADAQELEQEIFEIKRGEADEANKIIKKNEKKSEAQKISLPKEKTRPEDQDFSKWEKPPLELLEEGNSQVHVPDSELHEIGRKIVEKLAHFKIGVRMKSAFVGPTVTQFALEPDATVKLSKITGLKSELALALSAESVRIEAPIPGKNLVGIETPNPVRSTVLMKEILQSKEYTNTKGFLRLAIGKDVSGTPMVENLEEMPHLLIAGSTGSGKSVGMNTFIISMLFENSPADLRFIMVDPKRVELMPYEGIPHLLTPVITDAGKALSALRWAVSEMMRRLDEFSKVGARNIAEFNNHIEKKIQKQKDEIALGNLDENEVNIPKKVPRIVIIIDELADLMMREHKKETEGMICRIAQMARAVGMHLIIATQRPSVDVITGLIKANIPTRIAFTVTSSIDSRTVLDSIGAEDLLGRGDMLFTNPKFAKPKRVQGIYISGKEIEKVVRHLKINISDEDFFTDHIDLNEDAQHGSTDEYGTGYGEMNANGSNDDRLEEAIDLIRSTKKASASLLQRRLSVGYARAARMLDEMEEKGMIGPARGAKAREIFL